MVGYCPPRFTRGKACPVSESHLLRRAKVFASASSVAAVSSVRLLSLRTLLGSHVVRWAAEIPWFGRTLSLSLSANMAARYPTTTTNSAQDTSAEGNSNELPSKPTLIDGALFE
jgi:hypothetical protein